MTERVTEATADSVKRAYDNIADKWAEFRAGCTINKCIAEFVKLLPLHSEILDVGCGTGYPIAVFLEKKGFFVTGIDISDKMLEKARELHLPNAIFIKSDSRGSV